MYHGPHRKVTPDGPIEATTSFYDLPAFKLTHLAVLIAFWVADWLSSMKVADPSTTLHPAFQNAVDISLFAPRPGDLPRPDCVGQLIRLHRCKVWQGSYASLQSPIPPS